MTAMDCVQLADSAPELALGVLTGRERAEALEHLDTCNSCRQLVNSLSGVTDELLSGFAPSVEPSAGFEDRVLAAMTTAPVSSRSTGRRRVLAGLAVAACIALLIGVLVAIIPTPRPAVTAAEMRTPNGETVGWIYVDRGQPTNLYMTLPGWSDQLDRYGSAATSYSLHLATRSGDSQVLPVSLDSGAAWKATIDIDSDSITSAALVDDRGHVWCQAELTSA